MGVRIVEAGAAPVAAEAPVGVAPMATQAAVPAAVAEVAFAVDAKGRRIGVRRVNALALYRLTKVLGATATNQAALNLALSVASVVEIDGQPVSFPGTEMQVEALMGRLDFEGMAAATEALRTLNPDPEQIAATAGN